MNLRRLSTVVAVALFATTFPAQALGATAYCVSGEVSVPELHVPAGTVCEFDPNVNSTLRVTRGSILVEGTLRMRPSSSDIVHRIVFENVDEEGFVGGGLGPAGPHDPILDSDPGLWAMRDGVLDLVGSKKTGWTRDPDKAVGWKFNCELRVTPTKSGDYTSRPWRFGDSVPRAFPDVPSAEVFNLTRNVVISGTPQGRSHVFVRTNGPQTIKYAAFEQMGPECSCSGAEPTNNNKQTGPRPIVGRWALHFHIMGDGARGSLVEGVVTSHGAGRGFVPHSSHGMTFRDTVAYDVNAGGYWWDPNESGVKHQTEDTLFDHALAVDTTGTGFSLQDSEVPNSNVIRDSVAAGVLPDEFSTTTAGFGWGGRGDGAWLTDGVVSHNNRRNWYRWNNHPNPERSLDTTLYNGKANMIQGAYKANHLLEGMIVRGDLVEWKTSSGGKQPLQYPAAGIVDFDIDVNGRHPEALLLAGAQLAGSDPVVFRDGRLTGYTGSYAVTGKLLKNTRRFDFVRVVTKDGTELEPNDIKITPANKDKGLDTVVRIQQSNGTAWEITYKDGDPETDAPDGNQGENDNDEIKKKKKQIKKKLKKQLKKKLKKAKSKKKKKQLRKRFKKKLRRQLRKLNRQQNQVTEPETVRTVRRIAAFG